MVSRYVAHVFIIIIIIIIIIMQYEAEFFTRFIEYTSENMCVKPLLFVKSKPYLNCCGHESRRKYKQLITTTHIPFAQ